MQSGQLCCCFFPHLCCWSPHYSASVSSDLDNSSALLLGPVCSIATLQMLPVFFQKHKSYHITSQLKTSITSCRITFKSLRKILRIWLLLTSQGSFLAGKPLPSELLPTLCQVQSVAKKEVLVSSFFQEAFL